MALSQCGSEMIYLLRLCGLIETTCDSASYRTSVDSADYRRPAENRVRTAESPDRVGIWERKADDGRTYFVRNENMIAEYHRWSALGRIEPKGNRIRVVLIGESVARGYFYDPRFNPSMVLEEILRSQLCPAEVEVLDLARTGLGMEVRELARSALLLEPDAVIIFSGNNWGISAVEAASSVPAIDLAIRESGVAGLKRILELHLERQIKELMHDLAVVYSQGNVPLIWMVPEFNLGDWRDPVANAPFLAGSRNHDWIEFRDKAETALHRQDFGAASETARRLVELDEATTGAGFYILAECSLEAGDTQKARRYLELARDSSIWVITAGPPRAYSLTQNTLREQAAQNNNGLVDLPALFQEHLKSGIPGRELFLDYCHMTEEGIRIAMAGAAAAVVQVLQGAEVPWTVLAAECSAPSPEIEADAAFLAAVHNAHLWQSPDIVRHHCQRALRINPRTTEVMQHFIDLQSRRTPTLMCRAAERIAGTASQAVQSYLLGLNTQRLDPMLVDIIVDVLQELRISCGPHIHQLRRQEHSVTQREINLLDYYYCSASRQEKETMWAAPHAVPGLKLSHYYKAYSPASSFTLVADGGHPVQLRLTCRLSNWGPAEASMCLEMNGSVIMDTSLDGEWHTWDITVPQHLVLDGLNKITLRWPIPLFPGLKPFDKLAHALIQGFAPEFFYVFGEIHTFIASAYAASESKLDAERQSALETEQLSQVGRI